MQQQSAAAASRQLQLIAHAPPFVSINRVNGTNCAQATDAATHRWTVYVRGVNNEDLTPVVQKVRLCACVIV